MGADVSLRLSALHRLGPSGGCFDGERPDRPDMGACKHGERQRSVPPAPDEKVDPPHRKRAPHPEGGKAYPGERDVHDEDAKGCLQRLSIHYSSSVDLDCPRGGPRTPVHRPPRACDIGVTHTPTSRTCPSVDARLRSPRRPRGGP